MAAGYLGGEARVNDDENLEVGWFGVDGLPDVPPKHARAIEWAREPRAEGHFIAVKPRRPLPCGPGNGDGCKT